MKKHNATAYDRKQANNIKYSKSCKNCPYINVDCVNTEEEIYRWECFNGNYVDLHSWEKPYPHDFGYNGDCGIIIAQSEGGREMKTREEQIAEMAKAMSDFEMEDAAKCDIELSEHLFAKGYRKQSDTVREFVRRVKERYDSGWRLGDYDIIDLWTNIIYLAEEYGAGVEE